MTHKHTGAQELAERIRTHALGYPEAYEEFPWGEHAIKVKGKTFVFMHATPELVTFSVKLPQSKDIALMLPFTEPTGYGLGKSGWVSARFASDDQALPPDLIESWIDESYRALAPKKLVARLGEQSAAKRE